VIISAKLLFVYIIITRDDSEWW